MERKFTEQQLDNLFYFYDKRSKMMLKQKEKWEHGNGQGDALWRTSLAYICYPNQKQLKKGITNCFREFNMIGKKKTYIQACRCNPRYREDDVSRDQIIMALASLKINKDHNELKNIVKHLPYKLSRRFSMTPTMYMWTQALLDKKIYSFWFQLFMIFELMFAVPLSAIARILTKSNRKNRWYKDTRLITHPAYKIYKFIKYPDFSLHLAAWQFFTVEHLSLLSPILKFFIKMGTEKNNYLVRLLVGANVNVKDVINYTPRNKWRWEMRLNGEHTIKKVTDNALIYNAIDKHILFAILDYNGIEI